MTEGDRARFALAALNGEDQAVLALDRHLLGSNHCSQGFESVLDLALAALPERSCWELACEFARRALPVWEEANPNDRNPHRATEARRAWLAGDVEDEGLLVAHAAGQAAADSAVWQTGSHAAACAAFVVADPTSNAASAAILAAYAALDALGERERHWQTERVREALALVASAS